MVSCVKLKFSGELFDLNLTRLTALPLVFFLCGPFIFLVGPFKNMNSSVN